MKKILMALCVLLTSLGLNAQEDSTTLYVTKKSSLEYYKKYAKPCDSKYLHSGAVLLHNEKFIKLFGILDFTWYEVSQNNYSMRSESDKITVDIFLKSKNWEKIIDPFQPEVILSFVVKSDDGTLHYNSLSTKGLCRRFLSDVIPMMIGKIKDKDYFPLE